MGVIMKKLGGDKHWLVEGSIEKQLIRLERSTEKFESVKEVDDSFAMIRKAVSGLQLQNWGLLVDVRQVNPVSDPEIEKAMGHNRGPLFRVFNRQAVLLRSASGRMQASRLLKDESKSSLQTFGDEEEAIAWALGGK